MAAYVKSTLSRTAEQADSRIWTEELSHPKQESKTNKPTVPGPDIYLIYSKIHQ